MCDDFVEKEHPEWLCRDAAGKLVLEPRTRRRPNEADRKHVICFNSPAHKLVKTRLLELADRGVDGIYFDSWHMPEVCTCENCQAAFSAGDATRDERRGQTRVGRVLAGMPISRRSIVDHLDWEQAVKAKHPEVIFAISSSLYPCFDTQMQITTCSLLQISDTSKTEFSRAVRGFLGSPTADTGSRNRRPAGGSRTWTTHSLCRPTTCKCSRLELHPGLQRRTSR